MKKSRFSNLPTPSPYKAAASITVAGEKWNLVQEGAERNTYAHGDRTTTRTVMGSYS